jgi:thioredoxin-related protein
MSSHKARAQLLQLAGKGAALLAAITFLSAPCGAAASTESGAQTRDPHEFFFSQTFGDLPEELDQARQDGKLGMMLFFEQDGCPYCRRMMQTVFNQREVQDWFAERFVSFEIDIRGDVEIRDFDNVTLPSKVFAAQRRVDSTPVISFIDLRGTEVFRWSRAVTSPDTMLLMGRYVAEGRYTDTSWDEYSKGRQSSPVEASQIPHVENLKAEGEVATRQHKILLVAVTREGCLYCARLRREVLRPIIVSGEYSDRLVIREMVMEPLVEMVDFSGQGTTSSEIATRYGVSIAPTVLFLDGSGRMLRPPLVGINNADMYGFYLEKAIAEASAALDAARPDPME